MSDEPEYVELTTKEKLQGHLEDIARLQARIQWHREQIRELVGPFGVGVRVTVPRSGSKTSVATVIACDRAFGDWVVKVTFDDSSREYIYPANLLEAAE